MARARVFVSRRIFQNALDMFDKRIEIDLWEDELPPPRDILLRKVEGIDGLICLLTDKIDAELMDAAGPSLKVISQIAVGFDNIDVREATKRRIPVGNTPDVLTQTTADATWAILMAAARRVVEGSIAVRGGKWKTWHPLHYLGQDVYGSRLGIIGMGRIGLEVARRATGFDMEVIYTDVVRRQDIEQEYKMRYVDMDTLLKESDFVSIHTVLSESTHHLIDKEALSKMKKSAILVNAARGAIVDHQALYNALKTGVISAAGLDVTEPEPIPYNHPLLTLDNCVIVPHIASASVKTRAEMSRITVQNLINGLNGERLLTCVNPEVYDQ